MKLSTKGRYGLAAMIEIASLEKDGPVSITTISARQDISLRYLEQLMARLKKAGLVRSIRGAQGGYLLAERPDQMSVGAILRALEGSLDPVSCAGIEEGGCEMAASCRTKYVWEKLNTSINAVVDEMMLSDLLES